MKSVNCLIVDDEELGRALVATYIKRVPHLKIVGEAKNPIEAMQILSTTQVDLMFLDIQMPELTGIEFLDTIQQKPLVIFTTAYSDYALQGFELGVVDYLLKPFSFQRFMSAVNKATERLKWNQHPPLPTQQKEDSPQQKEKSHILIKSEHKIHRIPLEEITYIQGMREYVGYYLKDRRIMSLNSLKKLEVELPENKFLRIHKSYIIAIDKVEALEGNMVHIGGKTLPIGASYREVVKGRLFHDG